MRLFSFLLAFIVAGTSYANYSLQSEPIASSKEELESPDNDSDNEGNEEFRNDAPLPEFKASFLKFKACTADGYVANVQMKIINFSPQDLFLPEGYEWATQEENHEAALAVFTKNYGTYISYTPNAIALLGGYLAEVTLARDVIRGATEDGGVERRAVSLGLKTLLETKMRLMAQGKYSAMSVNFEHHNTFIEVDYFSECYPHRP